MASDPRPCVVCGFGEDFWRHDAAHSGTVKPHPYQPPAEPREGEALRSQQRVTELLAERCEGHGGESASDPDHSDVGLFETALIGELTALRAENDRLRAEVDAWRNERFRLAAELAETSVELERANTTVNSLSSQRTTLTLERDRLRATIAEIAARADGAASDAAKFMEPRGSSVLGIEDISAIIERSKV